MSDCPPGCSVDFHIRIFSRFLLFRKRSVGGEGGGQGQNKTKQNKKKIRMEGRGSGERALGAKKLPCE